MTFEQAFQAEVTAIGYDAPPLQRHHYRKLLMERVQPALSRIIPRSAACQAYLDSYENDYPHEVRVRSVCVTFPAYLVLMVPNTSEPFQIVVFPQSSIAKIVIEQSQWDDVEPSEHAIVRVRFELIAKRVKREADGVGSVQRQHAELRSSGARCLSLLNLVQSLLSA